MTNIVHNSRTPEVEVDSMFYDRWSPRAFRDESIPDRQLQSLFEAARWSPSCYNEQPWLFVYTTRKEEKKRFISALMKENQLWAQHAPVIIFCFARKVFKQTGKVNRHAPFDTGAAWMALALQARKLGLYAHAMAGFSQRQAFEITGVLPEEYEAMAAIAVGYRDDVSTLPEDLAVMESPNKRKSLADVAYEGRFSSGE
jgi:nitroreductase